MKLKDYIKILSSYDPEAEVLRKRKLNHKATILVEVSEKELFPPHIHFKHDVNSGKKSLVNSFVV